MVEHDLAKVGVASSSLVSRSMFQKMFRPLPNASPHKTSVPRGFIVYAVEKRGWLRQPCQQSTGRVAEWLCSGLQIRVRRFNSDLGLHRESIAPLGFQLSGAFCFSSLEIALSNNCPTGPMSPSWSVDGCGSISGPTSRWPAERPGRSMPPGGARRGPVKLMSDAWNKFVRTETLSRAPQLRRVTQSPT